MKDPIPPQHEGKQLDLQSERTLDSVEQSKDFYQLVKTRLLHAHEWYHIAEVPAATFVLTDWVGNKLMRKMQENDLLRIDIPGPGNSSGDGYDWVRVDKITEEENLTDELCSVTLRPTSNPENDDKEVAHFFKSMATSTILVKREGLKVIVEYHGRNELINSDTSKLTDKIRNMVVGLAAKLGLSFSQWKSLIEGLVDDKKD